MMKISKKGNNVEYEAAMKLIQDFNNKIEKQRELLQNQVTDSQRLEALESAVADLMMLSIKEENQ